MKRTPACKNYQRSLCNGLDSSIFVSTSACSTFQHCTPTSYFENVSHALNKYTFTRAIGVQKPQQINLALLAPHEKQTHLQYIRESHRNAPIGALNTTEDLCIRNLGMFHSENVRIACHKTSNRTIDRYYSTILWSTKTTHHQTLFYL